MKDRSYEALYIVPTALTEDEVSKIAEQYKEVVEKNGGTVTKAGLWEKRKLAYEIGNHRDGNYILMEFSAPSAAPAELSRLMGINDTIIRHRIFALEESK
ncbi:MAG: 30S ribosomal protein S6 [Armatimonadetes bacterium]|nr:30S ribosomal protein S6 [Armatimonadota bacterium]